MIDHHDHLILKVLAGTASPEESVEFSHWLEATDANKKTFLVYQKVWNESKPAIPDFRTSEEWIRLETVLNEEDSTIRRRTSQKYWLRIAASVVFLMLSTTALYMLFFAPRTLEYATNNNREEIVLPDGSKVWLNTNSRLTCSSDFHASRDVSLTGEAFFDVIPDASHPFIVHTGDATIHVLGTSFNVNARPLETTHEVYVVTGKVSLQTNRESITLTPGERGVLNTTNMSLSRQPIRDPNLLAWKNRQLIFRKTSLMDVTATLENYFDVSITLKNPSLSACHFTGSFEDPTLDEIIEALGHALSLNILHENNHYTVDGQGCENK